MNLLKHFLFISFLLPFTVHAWQPEKPITAIVGFAPGSGNEIAFRQASNIVTKNTGVTFVIENRPGADAVVSQNYMFTAAPDGYTLSVPSHMSLFVTNDIWQRDLKKFEYNSFVNVLTLGKSPLAVVANSTSGVNTPQEFVAALQSHRSISVAIGGGAHQMAYEYIMTQVNGDRTSVKMVRYPGPLQAVTAVASDSGVEFGIMPIAIAKPLIDGGKVKLLGLTAGKQRIIPGINVNAGWVVSLPPGTPADVVAWYQREFVRAIRSKEYQDWARDNHIVTVDSELSPAGVNKYAEELRAAFKNVKVQE